MGTVTNRTSKQEMCQGPCDLPFKDIATYSLLRGKKERPSHSA